MNIPQWVTDNGFVRFGWTQAEDVSKKFKHPRYSSALGDFIFYGSFGGLMIALFGLLTILFSKLNIDPNFFSNHVDSTPFGMRGLTNSWALSIALFFFFFKDFIHGKSIGKRINGFQVVDHRTGQQAQEWQLVLRNLTALIFWIEVVVLRFSPQRRIGDFLAGTRVEPSDPSSLVQLTEDIKTSPWPSKTTIIVCLLIVVFILPITSEIQRIILNIPASM